MNESTASDQKLPTTARGTLPGSLAVLTLALGVAFPCFAAVAYQQHGSWGLIAAGVAGGICWLAGVAALCCVAWTQKRAPLQGLMASMIFRMGLPLVAGVVLQETSPTLANAGIFGMVLLYYLITLAVETLLSVRLIRFPLQVTKAS